MGIIACQQPHQPDHANYYERCDTTPNRGAAVWLRNRLQQWQDQAPAQQFRHDVSTLLDALQQNDVAAARQYATDKALGTLLYLDIEAISHYEIADYQLRNQKATAYLRLNQADKPIRFYFDKPDSMWRFIGIELKDVDNGTPFRY